jgi:hypothetical protein
VTTDTPTARGALALLTESPIGCSAQLMRAHGFPTELIAKLVEAGFATTERILGGNRAIYVIRITDTGRVALTQRS